VASRLLRLRTSTISQARTARHNERLTAYPKNIATSLKLTPLRISSFRKEESVGSLFPGPPHSKGMSLRTVCTRRHIPAAHRIHRASPYPSVGISLSGVPRLTGPANNAYAFRKRVRHKKRLALRKNLSSPIPNALASQIARFARMYARWTYPWTCIRLAACIAFRFDPEARDGV